MIGFLTAFEDDTIGLVAEPKTRILVVDDDPLVRSLLEDLLGDAGYVVKAVGSAFQARGALARWAPQLVILDRGLPDVEGAEFIKEIRADKESAPLPVLFLTARGKPAEKTEGLEAGGDDYVAKPFDAGELLARVQALLRRASAPKVAPHRLSAHGLSVDLDRHEASIHGKPVHLPPKEFELLAVFVEKPGRVLSRRFLLERVWGEGMDLSMNTKTVDVAIGRLRTALGKLGERIVAVQSYGYRFDLE